jgi:MFS family permease
MSQLFVSLKRFSRETFTSFEVRNYRLYYISQVISTSGTFMQNIAQAWLVLELTNSSAALGIVSALQHIPILLFGTLGGVAADRFSKRTVLYFTQSAAGLLALILSILVATNQVTLWMVYILAFCLGWVNVFDNPARQTFVVETCDPSADLYELAGILRILCLASTTITRILRVHYIISGSESDLDRDTEEAIRQVNTELREKSNPPFLPNPNENDGATPSLLPSYQP